MSAPWTDEDERAAQEAARARAGHEGGCASGYCSAIYTSVLRAIEADRPATERRVLERVAKELAERAETQRRLWHAGSEDGDHLGRCHALEDAAEALAAAFPAWPRATGGVG